MVDAFPQEDPFSILVPPGLESFDIDKVRFTFRLHALDLSHVVAPWSLSFLPPLGKITEAAIPI